MNGVPPFRWQLCLLLIFAFVRTSLGQTNVSFADPQLEAAVRSALQKPSDPLTEADMLQLINLRALNFGIYSLSGLEAAHHLASLEIGQNGFTNIAPLTGLRELTNLDLSFTTINDFTPMASLTNLSTLNLGWARLKEIGFLHDLSSLSTLLLTENHIIHVSPLSGLTNLLVLDLRHNPISDFAPLVGLSKLNHLGLAFIGFDNAGPLTGLTNVQVLDVSGNEITDPTPLLALPAVVNLNLSANPLFHPASLAAFTNLLTLSLSDVGLTNLTPLAALKKLETLDLEGNGIADLSPLASLTNLVLLDLARNPATNYAVLEPLPKLANLNLSGNGVSNLTVLAGLSGLTGLQVTGDGISDLGPIVALTNLTYLDAGLNLLTDLKPLENLTNLTLVAVPENLLDLADGSPAMMTIQRLQNKGVLVYSQPQNAPAELLVRKKWLIAANQRTSIPFLLFDGGYAFVQPSVSGARSSNPGLIPDANLVAIGPQPAPGPQWDLWITPAKDQTGLATVTLGTTNYAGLWTNVAVDIEVVEPVPFAGGGLDSPELTWSTAGAPGWITQTAVSHDGNGAAQSGATNSWLQTRVTGPGTLSFWHRLISDVDYEFGEFTATSTEGMLVGSEIFFSGNDWQQSVLPLPAGEWVLQWSPEWRDWYSSATSNTLWLDEVRFVPGAPVPQLDISPPWNQPNDGSFGALLKGALGQTYDVEVSNDLVTWSPLKRVTCWGFYADFSDWNSAAPARFYRARLVP